MSRRIERIVLRAGLAIGLLLVAVLGVACDDGGPRRDKVATTPKADRPLSTSKGKPPPAATPPAVTASVSNIAIDWRDGQQTFQLTLTNHGDREETVRAIIYGKNDQIKPPRRTISPATAYPWFQLAHCKDGDLTARDIERSWNINAFGNGRSGKLVGFVAGDRAAARLAHHPGRAYARGQIAARGLGRQAAVAASASTSITSGCSRPPASASGRRPSCWTAPGRGAATTAPPKTRPTPSKRRPDC